LLKTTRVIAEHVSHTFKDAGEFRIGMMTQTLPALLEPALPNGLAGAAPNIMAVKRWKSEFKEYLYKVNKARGDNSQRIYGLILGQCTPAIRSPMEAHETWNAVDAASDVMGLLGIIQQCMTYSKEYKSFLV
jgi:hypothetical protein